MRKAASLLAFSLAALMAACQGVDPRGAGSAREVAESTIPGFVNQGWKREEREAFWFTSQGSRMLSYDIFQHLEQAQSEEPFRAAANIRRFGYIPWPRTERNPDGLPIGFVRDTGGRGSWMGFTCAACHTGVVRYQDRDILIDGAPTLADFSGFMSELVAAMQAAQQPPKLDRLASRITMESKEALLERLQRETTALAERQARNRSDTAYGHGRLDAFGQIFNEVTAHALDIEANAHPANAPVSYPFLWDTPHADRVQWPGIAENTPPIGALTRNVGEVLGVFAHLDIVPGLRPGLYPSSVRLPTLAKLENQLERLWRPDWEEAELPPLRPGLVAAGEGIYAERCARCHMVIKDPTDRAQQAHKATMVPIAEIGTDPLMVSNALRNGQRTGRIEGRRERVITGPRLPAQARSVSILTNAVAGTLVTDLPGTIEAIVIDRCDLTGVELDQAAPAEGAAPTARLDTLTARAGDRNLSSLERARTCRQAIAKAIAGRAGDLRRRLETEAKGAMQGGTQGLMPSYKARPLDGIWATAPYLHNGSVPTLHDLLEPIEKRPATFKVGSREFDPVKVGFRSDAAEEGSLLDTRTNGNSNAGHDGDRFGTTLSDQEKEALLEYLKSL